MLLYNVNCPICDFISLDHAFQVQLLLNVCHSFLWTCTHLADSTSMMHKKMYNVVLTNNACKIKNGYMHDSVQNYGTNITIQQVDHAILSQFL